MVWIICLVSFSTGYFFGTINATQTLFLKDTFNISATLVGILLAASAACSIIAMLFYPIKIRATYMSIIANIILIISVIVFPFSPHVAFSTVFLGLAYSCTAYLGTSAQIMMDTVLFPDVSVRASGWNIASYSVGTAIASFVAGALYTDRVFLPYIISGCLTFLILIPFLYCVWRYYQRMKKEMEAALSVILIASRWRRKAQQHFHPTSSQDLQTSSTEQVNKSNQTQEEHKKNQEHEDNSKKFGHENLLQAIQMNDQFGLGLFVRLKSLDLNKKFKLLTGQDHSV